MEKLQNNDSGFTLIELLMVIAIIAILSAVVLSSVGQTREKSKRASAITTAVSVMPELTSCADSNGFVSNSAPVAGNPICATNASPATTFLTGHNVPWPSFGTTGWAYAARSGTLLGGDYTFTVTKTGQNDIVCVAKTGSCS